MKSIASIVFLFSVMFTHADIAGYFTKHSQDWKFIQTVGGMKVSVKDSMLFVDCDVSGTKKVTLEPTMINSGMGVREIRHKRDGNTIRLTLVTSVIGKDITTSAKPIDISGYPDGVYAIEYLDPDGSKHALGEITLNRKKNDEEGGVAKPAAREGSK